MIATTILPSFILTRCWMASDDQLLFYGTVLPHAQAARQLVERALAQRLESQSDPALRALSGRLQALG